MDTDNIQLRMALANLWMMATGTQFVDITMPWRQQVEDIELRLKEQSRLPWHGMQYLVYSTRSR